MKGILITFCICIAFLGFAVGQEVNCEDLVDITRINEGYNYVEGDILIPIEDSEQYVMSTDPFAPQNAVARNPRNLWEGGVLPYELSSNLNQRALNAINNAMAFYTSRTCITFVERSDQANWIYFFPGGGCYSYIGNINRGRQELSIGNGCEFDGIVEHEIFHALGRWHEQSRPDRDQYIRINENNVIQGLINNFEIVSAEIASTQNLPYDFRSIMHYGRRAFSANGQDTITTLDSQFQTQIGQRERLSDTDIEHVRLLYCSGQTSQWGEWGAWSTCPESCSDYSRVRTRSCIGSDCPGNSMETESCGSADCGVEASWGEWGSWTQCTVSCGGTGYRYRQRACQNGNNCAGSAFDIDYSCNSQACVVAQWNAWTAYSACSQTCGGGTQTRTRTCTVQNQCVGPDTQTLECNSNACINDATIISESLRPLGCFQYASDNLFYYSNGSTFTLDIQVEAARNSAIVKCVRSVISRERIYFGMIDGYCIQEGSSTNTGLFEFAHEVSSNCVNRIGSYQIGLAMSVWYVYDPSGVTSREKRQTENFSNGTDTDTSEMDRTALECGINVDGSSGNGVGTLTPTLFSIVLMFSILMFLLQ